jgi:hypothetical protein
MGAENREKVREFDPDPVAAEYLRALERIVSTRHPGVASGDVAYPRAER